jgi:two-component system nitrogen regulation response regulator GlnG
VRRDGVSRTCSEILETDPNSSRLLVLSADCSGTWFIVEAMLDVFRSIQRAALVGFEPAIAALVEASRSLAPGAAISCVTIESDHVAGEPLVPELVDEARRAAWEGARGPFVPIVATAPGDRAFPIAVLVVREATDLAPLGELAGLVADTLVLARDAQAADPATGLMSVATFTRWTRRWLEIGRRRALPVSMLAIAIDGLAEINQRDGFQAGDRALREMVAFLVRELPAATAFGGIGGATTAVLLANTERDAAVAIADRLATTYQQKLARGTRIAVGVAASGEVGDDLLRAARAALVVARRQRLGVIAWEPAHALGEPDDVPVDNEYQRLLATWRLFEALCQGTQLDDLIANTLRALLPLFRADRVALWYEREGAWTRRMAIERGGPADPKFVPTDRQRVLIAEAAEGTDIASRDEADGRQIIAIGLRNAQRVTGVLEITHEAGMLRIDEGNLDFLRTVTRHIGRVIGELEALADARRQQQDTAERLRQQTIELRRLVRTSSGLLGNDATMQPVLRMIERSRASSLPVVITGETGTGKEAVARLVHRTSNRRGPFVVVDCGAIPAGLLESELFGHEKGAFTGAEARKIGQFEQAHQGTIFLDEIGELPLELQPKLLRVLQEQTVRRIGGRETITVDFRLIAATHRDLETMVAEGKFRQDLYFRMRVLEIHLPPLRDRGDDILLHALHWVRQYCAELGREMMTISPSAEDQLRAYPWPGNVRELQNVVRRAVLVAPRDELTAADLRLDVSSKRRQAQSAATPDPVPARPRDELAEAVAKWFWTTWVPKAESADPPQEAIEAFLLRAALRAGSGSISAAAKRLAMHPETFVAHLEKLGSPERSHAIRNDALAEILDRRLASPESDLRDDILRVLLTELLVHCRGNKSEMARWLGWGRQTLARRLRELAVVAQPE